LNLLPGEQKLLLVTIPAAIILVIILILPRRLGHLLGVLLQLLGMAIAARDYTDSIIATTTATVVAEATHAVSYYHRSISHNRLIDNADATTTTTTVAAPAAAVVGMLTAFVAPVSSMTKAAFVATVAFVATARLTAFIAVVVAMPSPKGIGTRSEVKNGQSQHR
jgi:hypothetical protein